jgi:hypothetical protein
MKTLLFFLLAVYFLPAIIAFCRGLRNRLIIAFGNLFLGWTGIGWLIFLLLSIGENPDAPRVEGKSLPLGDRNLVGRSGETARNRETFGLSNADPEVKALWSEFCALPPAEVSWDADYQRQARDQLKMIEERYQKIRITLLDKLSPDELTFSRYHDAALRVKQTVLSNLSVVCSLLRSQESKDVEYISKRIKALKKKSSLKQTEHDEIETLEERKRLIDSACEKASILLTKNEIAVTKLDKLRAALAEMNIQKGRVPEEFDACVHEMEELASRVRLYDSEPIDWEVERAESEKEKIW